MTILNHSDAVQLFHDNYVQFEGRLYYASVVGDSNNLELYDILESRNPNRTVVADPDVVTSPIDFKLGYLTDGNQDTWLSRSPRRNYGVGWNNGNVGAPSMSRWRRASKTLAAQFAGVYPNVKEALLRSKSSGGNRFAISRDFAVEDRNPSAQPGSNRELGIMSYRGQGICRIDQEFNCYDFPRQQAHLVTLFNEIKGV